MARETIERPTTRPSWHTRSSFLGDAFVIAVVGVLSLLMVAAANQLPDHVDHLTVSNPTEYELFVEVRGDQPGWLPLGIVSPRSDVRFVAPIDHGGTWELRFRSQGQVSDSISVARAELQARDWRLDVPDHVAAELRSAGAPPSPPR